MALVSLIRRIPLFGSLDNDEVETLAALLRRRSVRKGDAVFRKGDEGTALYAILRGGVKITVTTPVDDEITVAVMKDGDFFGEMALLDGMPRSATATAMEETQLAVLDRGDFLAFLMHRGHAVTAVLKALSLRLRRTDDLISEICFSNLSERLAKRIIEMTAANVRDDRAHAELEIRMTQKELSGMLGASRESVNKELKILRNKGIVRTSRGKIFVVDRESLKRRAK